jgi:glycine/D-amino acid oxidase-like deaminating enzyme
MTQRPGESPNGGQLILGGGFARAQNNGLGEIGVWTDDVTDPFTDAHLGGVLPAVFGQENWGEDSKDGRLVQGWSGVMAFTPDMLPYVGKLDPRTTGRHIGSKSKASTPQSNIAPGEWIAGGYCGDGMVNAWLSGVAVALMIMGEDEDVPKSPGIPGGRPVDWLPKAFKPDYHRIKSSSMLDFISHL